MARSAAGESYSAFMPADFTCRTKSQYPKAPSPATDPRKLCSPVRSRLKHGLKGRPLSVAHTASPFTLSVPGGRAKDRIGPEDRTIVIDLAEPAGPFEAVECEQFARDKSLSRIGVHGLSHGRSGCKQARNENSCPTNHLDFPRPVRLCRICMFVAGWVLKVQPGPLSQAGVTFRPQRDHSATRASYREHRYFVSG